MRKLVSVPDCNPGAISDVGSNPSAPTKKVWKYINYHYLCIVQFTFEVRSKRYLDFTSITKTQYLECAGFFVLYPLVDSRHHIKVSGGDLSKVTVITNSWKSPALHIPCNRHREARRTQENDKAKPTKVNT